MPRGRYVEKYELNGPDTRHANSSYGSFGADDEEIETHAILTRTMHDAETSGESDGDGPITIKTMNCDDGIRFRDGKKKIDYVLVYEESKQSRDGKSELYREKFLKNLRSSGVDTEEEIVPLANTSGDKDDHRFMHFIKLSAPWSVLCAYAEELSLRAPLQAHPNPSDNWSDAIIRRMRVPNPMYEFVPNKPLDFYTCLFKASKIEKFLGHENRDEFFSTTQRIRIIYELLQRTAFGKRKCAHIGIERLVEDRVFVAAFPLHDGPYLSSVVLDPQSYNKRQILYQYWARWSLWYKYQPIDHIRDYFGEKIAIYFAWIGFYTGWLIPASVVGIFVFIYGLLNVSSDTPSTEICSSGDKYLMCPLCDESEGCRYWSLSDVCLFSKLSVLFDHAGTVFYAVFISFWAVSFLEYWKRKSASLAHHWDCSDFDDEENPRPHFGAHAPYIERNPVTGNKEPAFPSKVRYLRMIAGHCAMTLMLILVMIFMIAVIIYRILVSIPLFQSDRYRGFASLIASSSGAFVNLLLIMTVGRVYEKLALRLTEWEMHRTQSEFDNQFAFKVFIFQFFNFYSSLFYIAFFKGRFVGRPGNYRTILGLRNEECSNYGCLMELTQQLAIIMIGKQVINNIREIVWPKILLWWHQKHTKFEGSATRTLSRWERDFQLIPYEGLFEEYLEMILQFGFITIFVAAFPLAPLFALLNNWFEIRMDAQKLVCETRRPIPERAKNIGIWFTILNLMAHIAVISNAFLIAFTSEFLPKMLYKYEYDTESLTGYVNFTLSTSPRGTMNHTCRYSDMRDDDGRLNQFHWKLMFLRFAFVVIFEHVVFSVCRLIDLLVPDVPKSVEQKIKRERYLAKMALNDNDTLIKVTIDEEYDGDGDAHE